MGAERSETASRSCKGYWRMSAMDSVVSSGSFTLALRSRAAPASQSVVAATAAARLRRAASHEQPNARGTGSP
jgi:hypothetical protein